MRRVTGSLALAALALVGGCASPAPPQDLAGSPARRGAVASRTPVVPCSTTYLVLATVSHCGADGFKLGVAGE